MSPMMPTTDRKEEVGLKGSEMDVFVGCSVFCGVGDKRRKTIECIRWNSFQ